jgi:hypothetical protein
MRRPARIFISYSHEDEPYLRRLVAHLSPLKRQGLIETWFDRDIQAGQEWAARIEGALREADLVLLLVTANFVASDYCYDKELATALERHARGEARVIPIIATPVDFSGTPFAGLQALPRDAKPVSTWPQPDEAWFDVAKGIRRVVDGS